MSKRRQKQTLTRKWLWIGAFLLGLVSAVMLASSNRFLSKPVPALTTPPPATPRNLTLTPLLNHQLPVDNGFLGALGIDSLLLSGSTTQEEAYVAEEVIFVEEQRQTVPSSQPSIPSIAIIIDDIGYLLPQGQRSARLRGDVTLAVIPFSPYADQLARYAQAQGKELMLHAPMEPDGQRGRFQGLTTHMDEQALRTELQRMLTSLPMVKGVNNHMGSALTQSTRAMSWVMNELFQRKLYFIDSRTTVKTTALTNAKDAKVASAKRDVFLDNVRTRPAIQQQFNKLLQIARTQGSAIAIGHPYPETLAFLEDVLHDIPRLGVKLVTVSQLLQQASTSHRQPRMLDSVAINATMHMSGRSTKPKTYVNGDLSHARD